MTPGKIHLPTLRRFWLAAETFAFVVMVACAIASIIVLTRPHAGHRGPIHWEVATILLFVALGADLVASIAHVTAEAFDE